MMKSVPLFLVLAATNATACTIPPGFKEDHGSIRSTYSLTVPSKNLTCLPDGMGGQQYGYSSTEYTYLCEGTELKMRFNERWPYYSFSIRDKAGNLYVESQNPSDWLDPVRVDECDTTTRKKITTYTIKAGGNTPMKFVFTDVTKTKIVPFTPSF